VQIEIVFKSGSRMNFECLDFLASEGLSLIMTPSGERVDLVKNQIEYFTVDPRERLPSNTPIPKTEMFFLGSKVLGYKNMAKWTKYYTKTKTIFRNNEKSTKGKRRVKA